MLDGIKTQKTEATDHAAAILAGSIFAERDLRDQLSAAVDSSTQTAVAKSLGISVQWLNDVLHGRKPISDDLADRLGFRRVVVFVGEGQ